MGDGERPVKQCSVRGGGRWGGAPPHLPPPLGKPTSRKEEVGFSNLFM